ncbi:MAG: DUF4364 family protein [Clostridia bacterium]|nr:DUF4364 family protein [Clostridia bacterium]
MERLWLPEEECRLTLLMCLDQLGPVTDAQLEEFVARLDLIGYFDMAVNLAALIDQKQIIRERHPAGLLLFVSGNGGQALDAFRNRIPASRRAAIEAQALEWRTRFKRSLQAPCRIEGKRAYCMLVESGTVLVEFALSLPEGTKPSAFRERWEAAAPGLWRQITAALYGDGRIPEKMPEEVRWEQRTVSESGHLTLPPAHPGSLQLQLTLDEEEDARRCAANWFLCRDELEKALLTALL